MSNSSTSSTSSTSTSSGVDFEKNQGSLLKIVGDKLAKYGTLVSGGILPEGGFGFLGVFTGKGTGVKESDRKELLENLEKFSKTLARATTVIEGYNEDQKRVSQLPLDIKTALRAVDDWATLVEQKKEHPDLINNIKSKAELLDGAIAAEILRFGIKVDQKIDWNTFVSSVHVKKPLEYYTDGKVLISQRKWNEAKDSFLAYQKFANAGQAGQLPSEVKIRDPHEDKHLEYLEYIQKNLEKIPTDDEFRMIASVVPTTPHNPYEDARITWRKKYPYRGSAA